MSPHNPGLYCYGNPLSAEARHRMTEAAETTKQDPYFFLKAPSTNVLQMRGSGSVSQSGLPLASLDVSVDITDPPCVVTIALTFN